MTTLSPLPSQRKEPLSGVTSPTLLFTSPRQSSQSQPLHSSALIKYHGRSSVVPANDQDYQFVLQKLISLTLDLQQTDMCRNDHEWKKFFENLSSFTNHMMNPNSVVVRYQLEIINDCLLPYITKLKARFYTDKERVHQLSLIMHALSIQHDNDAMNIQIHPAVSLAMLEQVREQIRDKQSYLWKSELLTILDPALDKQWRPILMDFRLFLQDIAGKLFAIFLFTMIGWPLAFAYPIYANSKRLLKIVNEWETTRKVSSQSLFDLAKTVIMIFALFQVMALVAVYQSVGYVSALLASAAVFISLNDSLLKTVVPILTPYAISYDKFLLHMSQLSFSQAIEAIQHVISKKPSLVEELPPPKISATPSDNVDKSNRDTLSKLTVTIAVAEPSAPSEETNLQPSTAAKPMVEAVTVEAVATVESHSDSEEGFVMIDNSKTESSLGLRQRTH